MTGLVSVHVCRQTENPRRPGFCACGRQLAALPARDREFERDATRHIATALGLNVEALNVFAERRADQFAREYGHDFPSLDRNLEQEALDELADCRNYIVWRLDAVHRGLCEDEDRVPHLQRALRHVALAFDEVRAAQR